MASNLFSWPSLFSSPDEKAMWRVRSEDDAQAFAELVGRWHGPIRGLCTRMTREIGVVLGIPEGTVKSRMFEALAQLNELLNPMISDVPKTARPPAAKPDTLSRPPERLLI
jgi:hypothetical protein